MIALFLANGFEETEALAPLDLLRRAGCDIYTVGIGGKEITGSNQIKVIADYTDTEVDPSKIEGVILPGGLPGADNLNASAFVKECVLKCAEKKQLVAAICAAPYVLGKLGVLNGRNAICYPGYENQLLGAKISSSPVCVDGNIITAKGAGVSVDFGLELAAYLCGRDVSDKIRKGIQCQ